MQQHMSYPLFGSGEISRPLHTALQTIWSYSTLTSVCHTHFSLHMAQSSMVHMYICSCNNHLMCNNRKQCPHSSILNLLYLFRTFNLFLRVGVACKTMAKVLCLRMCPTYILIYLCVCMCVSSTAINNRWLAVYIVLVCIALSDWETGLSFSL